MAKKRYHLVAFAEETIGRRRDCWPSTFWRFLDVCWVEIHGSEELIVVSNSGDISLG
jgi:hypothetical protein